MSSTVPNFVVPPSVLLREVDGEMVLLNIATEQYYGLDTVGAAIVAELLVGPREGAIETLLGRYTVSRERLVADLDALVARLTATGLLALSASD